MSYNVNTAVEKVQSLSWAKFDESVEIAVNLGVDPRKQTQMVKGVARLPHGTGKQKRIGVFATGGDAQAALEAGADVVGGEELIARIQRGELPFDTAIATPEMMSQVSKIGRILGPRSMMPNPKMGTVTKDITKAVNAAKAGQVQFRVEKKGIVHAGIGKVSFSKEALLDNIRAFMIAIGDHKPENFKGDYLLGVSMSSTMGPGIKVAKSSIDPSKASFMVEEGEL
jgi:large subunit ribosomal protein L1